MDADSVAEISDPTERAKAINRLIDEHTEAINRLSPLRKFALEEMRLPQIAHVVIDAAAFAPARHRPDIARQHREQTDAAEEPENFILPMSNPVCPLLGAARVRSNRTSRQRHVAIGASPSRTSAIRSRVPLVVSAGSAPAS